MIECGGGQKGIIRKEKKLAHYIKLLGNILLPFAGLFLLVTLGPKLLFFFLPFVLAYFVAFLANPLVVYLQRHIRIKRRYSSIMITVVVLAAVVLVIYLCILAFIALFRGMVEAVPDYYQSFLASVDELTVRYQDIIRRFPPEILQQITDLRSSIGSMLTELVSKAADPTISLSMSAVRSVPSVFINALVFFLAAFCFIIEWENIQIRLHSMMPVWLERYIAYLKNDIRNIFSSWLLAQFKIMFVVFLVLAAAFLLLKVHYAVPLAVLVSFLDFLPALGVGFILWPWMAIELLKGKYMLALCLGLTYLLTQVVRHTLQPKIMGDTMGLPPLWTLLFLYLGFKFYGIAGMIFAVPVGMFFLSLVRYGIFREAVRSAKELASLWSKIK